LKVLSSPHDTSLLPSGLKLAAYTVSLWPAIIKNCIIQMWADAEEAEQQNYIHVISYETWNWSRVSHFSDWHLFNCTQF
jgi:hypothetical protein